MTVSLYTCQLLQLQVSSLKFLNQQLLVKYVNDVNNMAKLTLLKLVSQPNLPYGVVDPCNLLYLSGEIIA